MRQLVYTSLLLIIKFHFTYSERKICSTIKNSQDMNMTVNVDTELKRAALSTIPTSRGIMKSLQQFPSQKDAGRNHVILPCHAVSAEKISI